MNTESVRCFIAIKLPSDVRVQIESYVQNLARYTKMVRWVKSDSLHLTLKFLGEIEYSKLEIIKSRLERVDLVGSSFDIKIIGSGCFPGHKKPQVFWLGVDRNAVSHLSEIQFWLEEVLSQVGFEKEKRRFSPHLTIGRVKGNESFSELYSYLDRHQFSSKKFRVENIFLIRSILKPTGAEYEVLGTYPL